MMRVAAVAEQPFQILLELVQEHKLDPWEVDIEKLARALMQRMRQEEERNLRAHGRTLLSASTLLRMKSDYAVNGGRSEQTLEEELEEVPEFNLAEFGQVTIIHRAPRQITLAELLDALHEVLGEIRIHGPRARHKIEKVVRALSEYHINIEKYLERLYARIIELTDDGGALTLSRLVEGQTRLEVARTLLLLLFLSGREKISLRQEQPFGEIFISVGGK